MELDIKRILKSIKVEDGHILLGEPIIIEKYGKKITIDQINWFYKWDKFVYNLGMFLNLYSFVGEALQIPNSLEDLETFRKNLKIVISNKATSKKALKHLIKIFKLYGLKVRWIKKHFTVDDYLELFAYAYLFNIMGVKKNTSLVLKTIQKAQSS